MARYDEAFTDFVDRRGSTLLRVAYYMCHDRERAQDLVQQAFMKTYVAWPQLRDPAHAEAYCRRAIVNTNISWWRRLSNQRERATDDLSTMPAPAADATEGVLHRDELLGFLAQLPERQRAVMVLRYYEDLSENEIATTLDISVGSVKSHASRALARLRALADAGQEVNAGREAGSEATS